MKQICQLSARIDLKPGDPRQEVYYLFFLFKLFLSPICFFDFLVLFLASATSQRYEDNPFKMPPDHQLFVAINKERALKKEVCHSFSFFKQ